MQRKLLTLKSALITLFFLSTTLLLKAQGVAFEWAGNMGGAISPTYGNAVAVDAAGNVYTTGYFNDLADFDPGTGTANLTSNGSQDIFISKLDPAGNFVWVKQIGGTLADQGWAIATDTAGNVYATGYFSGTVDFDPGAGTTSFTSFGSVDIFIVKLSPAGNFIWAKQLGGTGYDQAAGLKVDRAGNVYTTGYFQNMADFDPGAGVATLTTAGGFDAFVSRLNTNGDYVWARKFGGPSSEFGNAIALDAAGNVYTTGIFGGTADFDPGAGTANLTSAGSQDIFVAKLNTDGNYVWARGMGSASADQGSGLDVDSAGNSYITGNFSNTVDFDPGAGTANLTSAGSTDAFVLKLNPSGDYVWAKQIGGAGSDLGMAVAIDAAGNPLYAGYYNSTVDFDPGTGTANRTSAGVDDIFVSKLTSAGNFAWAKSLGGFSNDYGFALAVNPSGNVYTTGVFNGIADFDPDAGTFNLNSNSGNMYVQKMHCVDTNSSYITQAVCDSITLNGITYRTTGTYTQKRTNMSGCDSTLRLNLTIYQIIPAVIARTGASLGTTAIYNTYSWLLNGTAITGATGSTYTPTANGTYKVVVTDLHGCKDTSDPFIMTGVGVGNAPSVAGQIKVFPNPARDMIYIQSPVKVNISIAGMEGKVIRAQQQAAQLSVSDLADGIYLLRITDQQGTLLRTEKFIKSR